MSQGVYVGRTLKNRYQLLTRLGAGGFSSVYLAQDTQVGTVVAVKVLHEHLAGESKYVRQFLKEAEKVAKLHNPEENCEENWGQSLIIFDSREKEPHQAFPCVWRLTPIRSRPSAPPLDSGQKNHRTEPSAGRLHQGCLGLTLVRRRLPCRHGSPGSLPQARIE